MQTMGGAGAILSVLFGLLGGKPENRILLRTSLVIGGVVFGLLALLGYRLGKRQDDCEQVMGKIESSLQSMGYAAVANMPTGGRPSGQETAIVLFLSVVGASLVIVGLIR
jgi:hypothetical protein